MGKRGERTMAPIRLAIVGCGGMGHRHLYGLAELARASASSVIALAGSDTFDLVAACVPVRANAESLAAEAAGRLGSRPAVVGDLAELTPLGVEAVDVTTTPRTHHTIVVEALE